MTTTSSSSPVSSSIIIIINHHHHHHFIFKNIHNIFHNKWWFHHNKHIILVIFLYLKAGNTCSCGTSGYTQGVNVWNFNIPPSSEVFCILVLDFLRFSVLTLWGVWWALPRLCNHSRNIHTAPVPPGSDSWPRFQAQWPTISSRSFQVTRLSDPQLLQSVRTKNTYTFRPGKELRGSRLSSQRGVREGEKLNLTGNNRRGKSACSNPWNLTSLVTTT